MNKLFRLIVCTLFIGSCYAQEIPDDVSFCIADVKFDGENLKILEFGDCAESMFTGYDALYGEGAVWAAFWKYLKRFDLPIWYVGKQHKFLGLDTLKKLGGSCLLNTSKLRMSIEEKMRLKKIQLDKVGIVFLKKHQYRASAVALRHKFSSLIFVNQMVHHHVISKYRTNLLFRSNRDIKKFRPRCTVASRKYTPQLAQSIIREVDAPIYVIKPTCASRGKGVVFVEKDELDAMLRILCKDRVLLRKLARTNYHTFGFWLTTKLQHFLIEEYVPSKSIIVSGRPYDATMRLVFAMSLTNGKPAIDVLAAYWKLPAKALNENGSLNEKHRSDVHSSASVNSVKVQPDDFEKVSSQLTFVMQNIYLRMLRRYFRYNQELLQLLSS